MGGAEGAGAVHAMGRPYWEPTGDSGPPQVDLSKSATSWQWLGAHACLIQPPPTPREIRPCPVLQRARSPRDQS